MDGSCGAGGPSPRSDLASRSLPGPAAAAATGTAEAAPTRDEAPGGAAHPCRARTRRQPATRDRGRLRGAPLTGAEHPAVAVRGGGMARDPQDPLQPPRRAQPRCCGWRLSAGCWTTPRCLRRARRCPPQSRRRQTRCRRSLRGCCRPMPFFCRTGRGWSSIECRSTPCGPARRGAAATRRPPRWPGHTADLGLNPNTERQHPRCCTCRGRARGDTSTTHDRLTSAVTMQS